MGEVAVARPLTQRFIKAKSQGIAQIKVIEGAGHVQAYDRPEYVSQGIAALSRFGHQRLAA